MLVEKFIVVTIEEQDFVVETDLTHNGSFLDTSKRYLLAHTLEKEFNTELEAIGWAGVLAASKQIVGIEVRKIYVTI